jgi:hypothetical protein
LEASVSRYDPRVRFYFEGRAIGRDLSEDLTRFPAKMLKGNPVISRDRLVWDQRAAHYPPLDDHGLMKLYFDAAVYFDGSGPRSVMFRLPASLEGMVQPYLIGGDDYGVTAGAAGGDLVVRIAREEADGENMYSDDTPERWLEPILPARDSLLAGDPAALYLGWRMLAESPVEAPPSPMPPAPPKPPGLDSLSPPLEALDQILRPWQVHGKGSSRP